MSIIHLQHTHRRGPLCAKSGGRHAGASGAPSCVGWGGAGAVSADRVVVVVVVTGYYPECTVQYSSVHFHCVGTRGISIIVEREKGRGCQKAKTRHKIAKAPVREGQGES